jgi:apoptosis-inducing factor 2
VLNSRGQIKIRTTFQLESYSNIYAIGDVTNLAEQKQATKAPKHAQIAAANILAQLRGSRPKKTYSGQPELIIITNGKVCRCSVRFRSSSLSNVPCIWQKQGISFMGMLWGITLGNWFSSSMKGKELMVSMTRKSYGLSK